jgi:hypothetical protein
VALCRLLTYRHHVAALERGLWNHQKGYGRLPRACSRRHRDVGPGECVPFVTSSPVHPCPPLWHHPRRYSAIPGTAAPSPTLWKLGMMRHRHARCCASSGLLSAEPSSWRTDGNQTGSPHSATLEATPGQIQDSPRRPSGVRFTRTTINSAKLCAMLPYVAPRVVRHDCKPSPLGL